MSEHTRPTKETREAERDEADAPHDADQVPTDDEARAADEAREDLGDREGEVAEHYREMTDLGAHAKGEGRLP